MNEEMELKERIIETAMKMFTKEGIKAVRMDDIASECGVSKRTLYETFADRDNLIRESLEYYVSHYEHITEQKLAAADNALDEFWIIFGQGEGMRESNRKVMSDLFKFYPQIFSDFINTHHCHIQEKNAERFRRGQDEGLILKDIDVGLMSRNLTGYLYGIKRELGGIMSDMWEEDFQDGLTRINPRSFQFVIMLYFRGMATEKGRRYIDDVILTGIK